MLAFSALAFQLTWHSRATLPEPRAGLIHAVVDGRLLTAGGTFWMDNRKNWSRRCDFFDPKANQWLPGPPMPSSRADSTAVTVGKDVYFLGGSSDGQALDDVLVFRNGAWESRPEMKLPAPRSYGNAAVFHRRIYLFGGMEKPGDLTSIRDSVWVWDLSQPGKGWKQVGPIPAPFRSNFAFTYTGTRAYLFGGVTSTASGIRNLAEAWAYDFEKNSWAALPALPEANRALAGVTADGSILLLGGYTEQFSAKVVRFNESSGKYDYLNDLPQGLADARFLWIDNKLYVTGGESGIKIRSANTWEGKLQ